VQDLVRCDYNRTPAVFQGVDIYRFVGDICNTIKKAGPNVTLLMFFDEDYFLKNFFFPIPARPTRPLPRKSMVARSGTEATLY
jgi:hypothetical protein